MTAAPPGLPTGPRTAGPACAAVAGGSTTAGPWARVCRLDQLDAERGAAALVQGRQIALFRLGDEEVRAVDHRDPFCGANVIARGIVGSAGPVVYVASPMHKQRFDLRSGRCLDDPAAALAVWPVRVVDGHVELLVGAAPGA